MEIQRLMELIRALLWPLSSVEFHISGDNLSLLARTSGLLGATCDGSQSVFASLYGPSAERVLAVARARCGSKRATLFSVDGTISEGRYFNHHNRMNRSTKTSTPSC
nr:uncharacterized protein LOC115269916 [Aedes albopictus]